MSRRKKFKDPRKPWRGRQFRKLIERWIAAEREVMRLAELRAARNARARERRRLRRAGELQAEAP